jgi:hypothetical protein
MVIRRRKKIFFLLIFIFYSLEKYSSNGHTNNKRTQTVDENCNILKNFDVSSNELVSNNYIIKNENDENFIDSDNIEQTVDDINSKIINQKTLLIVRPTPLDAIVEDLNEENSDDLDETIQPVR